MILTQHVCVFRLVSSLPLRMTDAAVNRVLSDIIRSPEDKRAYRGLEFSNGLKAMLISDPTTDKSSAALDVQIGNSVQMFICPANNKGPDHTDLESCREKTCK